MAEFWSYCTCHSLRDPVLVALQIQVASAHSRKGGQVKHATDFKAQVQCNQREEKEKKPISVCDLDILSDILYPPL